MHSPYKYQLAMMGVKTGSGTWQMPLTEQFFQPLT